VEITKLKPTQTNHLDWFGFRFSLAINGLGWFGFGHLANGVGWFGFWLGLQMVWLFGFPENNSHWFAA
jgi:hypothetical protein